jgi:hypothetical protein
MTARMMPADELFARILAGIGVALAIIMILS